MAKYMVSENEITQSDTLLGRSKKMVQLMDYGHDENDIALLFGCSVKTIQTTVALMDATQAVQVAVKSGTVTVIQARQMVDMPPEKQRETLRQLKAAAEGVTGHEKARRQRAVLGNTKPRLKTRKEITKALEGASGEYAEALRWVLREPSHD